MRRLCRQERSATASQHSWSPANRVRTPHEASVNPATIILHAARELVTLPAGIFSSRGAKTATRR
jgi:hypothetical protein